MSSPATAAKAQLTAYQRWELDTFDASGPGFGDARLPTAGQIEQMHKQAQEEGYAAGYREGSARAAAEAERLRQIVAAMTDASQKYDQALADELLQLAVTIARQVLRQALKLRPELILGVVNEVLGQLPLAHRHARLILNPEDVALVRLALGERLKQSGWELVENAAIARGGCRLESPDCEIDATLEQRWQRVIDALGQEHAWAE